jgi:polyhydroxyalkanoate synthesis regulator phasin
MKKLFKKSIWGYHCITVNQYIDSMKKDYNDDLVAKKERIFELNDSLRSLKEKILDLSNELDKYKENEKYISKVMVRAEAKAYAIQEEGKDQYDTLLKQIDKERENWAHYFQTSISKVKEFQNEMILTLDEYCTGISMLENREMEKMMLLDKNVICTNRDNIYLENENNIEFDILKKQCEVDDSKDLLRQSCEELGIYSENND